MGEGGWRDYLPEDHGLGQRRLALDPERSISICPRALAKKVSSGYTILGLGFTTGKGIQLLRVRTFESISPVDRCVESASLVRRAFPGCGCPPSWLS